MAVYKDRGVVASGFRLGEADKILTVLTEGRGLVRAVAKGVRRTKSRFGGRLEPLTHVSLLIYEGRNLDVVSQVDTIDSYRTLRAVPDRLAVGWAVVEAASRAAHEHEPAPRLYRLVVAGLAGLDGLEAGEPVPPLYLTVFLLRLMDVAGLAFAADGCAACGAAGPVQRIGIAEGGGLCERCVTASAYRVQPETVALLLELSRGRVAETAQRAGAPSAAMEAAALVRRFVEYHLDVRLRAPAINERTLA